MQSVVPRPLRAGRTDIDVVSSAISGRPEPGARAAHVRRHAAALVADDDLQALVVGLGEHRDVAVRAVAVAVEHGVGDRLGDGQAYGVEPRVRHARLTGELEDLAARVGHVLGTCGKALFTCECTPFGYPVAAGSADTRVKP